MRRLLRACGVLRRAFLCLLLHAAQHCAADTVPLAFHDGLVWTDLLCAGQHLHFVVDTGAAISCIDAAAARKLHLAMGPSLPVAGVDGSAQGRECTGFQGSLAGIPFARTLLALDLSRASRGCSQRIDGLIGADFFNHRVLCLDYARGSLSACHRPERGQGVATRAINGAICIPVSLGGGAARWTRLDTGCAAALEWCGPQARPTAGPPRCGTIAVTRDSSAGCNADIAIGSTRIGGVPVRFRDREIFPGEAGLLGSGALKGRLLVIDGISRRVVIGPAL